MKIVIMKIINPEFQIVLEYLIKTGTEKVAQQCKENIYAIQTLKEFQHYEEGNDHGLRVREKAKQLVSLLKDDERLKNERTKALKAKERFAQNASGFGSDGSIDGPSHREVGVDVIFLLYGIKWALFAVVFRVHHGDLIPKFHVLAQRKLNTYGRKPLAKKNYNCNWQWQCHVKKLSKKRQNDVAMMFDYNWH